MVAHLNYTDTKIAANTLILNFSVLTERENFMTPKLIRRLGILYIRSSKNLVA